MSVVAIQGVRGSYSEEATFKLLGKSAEILECRKFEDAFQSLIQNRAEYAVIPFKNKIVGAIETPHALLKNSDLKILDELPLEVRHVLVGTKNAEFETLKSVRSHVEALKQCRRFFSNNLNLQQIIGADTASSIRRVVEENDSGNAAIGSRRAAEIYGAKILKENIADDPENWTTFYFICYENNFTRRQSNDYHDEQNGERRGSQPNYQSTESEKLHAAHDRQRLRSHRRARQRRGD